MAEELKVISEFYDFMLWLIRHTEKFPRHHRYSLGTAIEQRLQLLLSLLLKAKFSSEKTALLAEANVELETLRFQLRLANDLHAMPPKSIGHAAGVMQAIGSQIGGWLKSKVKLDAARSNRGGQA